MAKSKPTEYQLKVAVQLGLDVADDSMAVAAARIGDIVGPALDPEDAVRSPSERQIAFSRSLGFDVSRDTFRVASARIDDALRLKNLDALANLRLKPGDKVATRHTAPVAGRSQKYVREWVVSSVRPDGRVFFKGGNGKGAWASQLERLSSEHGS